MIIDDLENFEVVSDPNSIRGGLHFSPAKFARFIKNNSKDSGNSNTEYYNFVYTRSVNNGQTNSYYYESSSSS